MSRPRAADDFATMPIAWRNCAASAKWRPDKTPPIPTQTAESARNADGRSRPDKGELPGLGVGRRYLPARQR